MIDRRFITFTITIDLIQNLRIFFRGGIGGSCHAAEQQGIEYRTGFSPEDRKGFPLLIIKMKSRKKIKEYQKYGNARKNSADPPKKGFALSRIPFGSLRTLFLPLLAHQYPPRRPIDRNQMVIFLKRAKIIPNRSRFENQR